ncbi:MAG: DUF4230 domain-containing protein [Rhodothermales bacterium]|nr:DUF4230 domain-containing protein [Rhodothermales bacterium]
MRSSRPKAWERAAAVVFIAVALTFVLLFLLRPRWDETVIRRTVITTIQSEAPASFYVTGTLQLTATSEVEDTRVLLPNLLPLSLGTTRATVRLPGTVAYGFDASDLQPTHVDIGGDGIVTVTLPALQVFSVEPSLTDMEVRTDVGWARTHAGSGQAATQEAIRMAQDILRDQATTHLQTNQQPRINTATALVALLTPVLQSAGVNDPQFEFRIGDHLVMRPAG